MAEVKRTAHKGKMNRDLDDRLVPDGEYRLGVNVNIGRSDGSDVGAVENLQGNILQDVANDPLLQNSEVIGQVKDPNSDKIYYFTTSDSIDANGLENGVDQIREFDAATGNIKTILTDTKATNRDGSLPTCLPLITTDITLPDGVLAIPPGFPAFPPEPVPGCTDPTATNFDPNATFDDNSCMFGFGCANAGFTAEVDAGTLVGFVARGTLNSISGPATVGGTATGIIQIPAGESNFPGTITCTATITAAQFRVGVAGDQTALNGDVVTLTAAQANGVTPVTFSWSDGTSGNTTTVTGTNQTVTILLTGTDANGQVASASHSVLFAATPPGPSTYTLTNTPAGTGYTLTGTVTASAVPGTAFSATAGISVDSGFIFNGTPVGTFSGGNGGTGTQSGNTVQVTDTHGIGNITANVNWTNVATTSTGGGGALPYTANYSGMTITDNSTIPGNSFNGYTVQGVLTITSADGSVVPNGLTVSGTIGVFLQAANTPPSAGADTASFSATTILGAGIVVLNAVTTARYASFPTTVFLAGRQPGGFGFTTSVDGTEVAITGLTANPNSPQVTVANHQTS